MKVEAKANCPLDGFKPCKQLDCAWFIKVSGVNPNTGDQVDEWGCSMSWLPILMIENSQQQRQTSAAVESFRNEMARSNEASHQALLAFAQHTSNQQSFILESKS